MRYAIISSDLSQRIGAGPIAFHWKRNRHAYFCAGAWGAAHLETTSNVQDPLFHTEKAESTPLHDFGSIKSTPGVRHRQPYLSGRLFEREGNAIRIGVLGYILQAFL